MALKLPAKEAAQVAIASIGRGYDVAVDLRLKYCKGDSAGSQLIEIDDADGSRDLVLPGGISIPNVSRSIKGNARVSGLQLSLTGKYPLDCSMRCLKFQGFWQKDAASTKSGPLMGCSSHCTLLPYKSRKLFSVIK